MSRRTPQAISFEELAERQRCAALAAGIKPALTNTQHSMNPETLARWEEFEASNRALPHGQQVD